MAILLLSAACGGPNTPGPPPTPYSGVVYGVVQNGARVPIAGVRVESEAYRNECTSSGKVGGSSPIVALTDAAGTFRQQIVTSDSSQRQCIRVIARPLTGAAVVVETTGLRVKPYEGGSTRDDSIRVDVILP